LENVRITVNGDVATEVSVCTILRQAVRPIMLLGGDKTGDERWYEVNVPRADALYDEHVRTLEQEGLV